MRCRYSYVCIEMYTPIHCVWLRCFALAIYFSIWCLTLFMKFCFPCSLSLSFSVSDCSQFCPLKMQTHLFYFVNRGTFSFAASAQLCCVFVYSNIIVLYRTYVGICVYCMCTYTNNIIIYVRVYGQLYVCMGKTHKVLNWFWPGYIVYYCILCSTLFCSALQLFTFFSSSCFAKWWK